MRYIFILIFLIPHLIFAQKDSVYDPKVGIQVALFTFIQNNEYFNHIADGYTIVGSQFAPRISYKPDPSLEVSVGLFNLYYAGKEHYDKIIPTLSIQYQKGKNHWTMGTLLQPKHGLLAPMYAKETQFDARGLEYGLQWQRKSERFPLDVWLNWENMIFKGDTKHEEFVQGIATSYTWYQDKNWHIKTPFQNLFYHHGGQINTDELEPRNTFTIRNTNLGMEIGHRFSEKNILAWHSYLLLYQNSSSESPYPFQKGKALLIKMEYQWKDFTINGGYWYGDAFISPRGDDMFQSYSRKTDTHYENGVLVPMFSLHTEKERKLWLGEFHYQKMLLPSFVVSFHTNLYYQAYASNPTPQDASKTISKNWDYQMGLSLRYMLGFKI